MRREYDPENEPAWVGCGAGITVLLILLALGYCAYVVVEKIILMLGG